VLGRGWDGGPSEPGGPRGWAPLLYVCHSCFASADLARDLLARGADPRAAAGPEQATPLAWAAHGSANAGGGDHVAVAEALVAAGAEPEPRMLDVADGTLHDWLAARLS
jgi:hypothetical protein